jgi:hypothetical protein
MRAIAEIVDNAFGAQLLNGFDDMIETMDMRL